MTQWVKFDTAQDVAAAAADAIQEHARHAIKLRGEYKLVLAGGTSPLASYKILAGRDLEWDKWKLFYGDERCLPVDDAERNNQIIASTGLTEFVDKHYVIPSELGSVKGAESYQSKISDQLPFDTVLLGMGEDGHTASLFPGLDWQVKQDGQLTQAVHNAPKAPAERISLTLSALQNCFQMLVLVSGKSKREAVQQWQHGNRLPVVEVSDVKQATVYVEASLML